MEPFFIFIYLSCSFMKEITFYFDFLSPFSFFAWKELHHRNELKITYKPAALGPLLNHWGIKGPGEVEPKREFLLKQCLRYAAKNNIAFTTPKTHPFNSLYALRLALKSTAAELQPQVIKALWEAGWEKRIDMGEPDELKAALSAANLPAEELFEKSFSKEARAELKNNIQEAISLGVFGVPSFVAGEELFWGKDAISDLMDFLDGKDSLDRHKLKDLLDSTPRAAKQSF
jgi:2-hydroxychromene-2-carboxylate isomerase